MNTFSTAAPALEPRRTGFARHSLARAVVAVGGAFCVAAAGLALWPEEASAAAPVEAAAVPSERSMAPVRGVIEKIRHSEAKDGAAAFYEFDVRLPNGSLRQSRDTQAGIWQVGERMQLLGGERTWSTH